MTEVGNIRLPNSDLSEFGSPKMTEVGNIRLRVVVVERQMVAIRARTLLFRCLVGTIVVGILVLLASEDLLGDQT
jgi:hypothetical protein